MAKQATQAQKPLQPSSQRVPTVPLPSNVPSTADVLAGKATAKRTTGTPQPLAFAISDSAGNVLASGQIPYTEFESGTDGYYTRATDVMPTKATGGTAKCSLSVMLIRSGIGEDEKAQRATRVRTAKAAEKGMTLAQYEGRVKGGKGKGTTTTAW